MQAIFEAPVLAFVLRIPPFSRDRVDRPMPGRVERIPLTNSLVAPFPQLAIPADACLEFGRMEASHPATSDFPSAL